MGTFIHEDGVENVAVGIIRQARKDFIRGGKILYKHLKKIPEYSELIKDKKHISLSNDGDVRMMYDSWRFVMRDPYDMFEDAGKNKVIAAWTFDTIITYYQELYLKSATEAYRSGFKKKKKELYELADKSIKKYFKTESSREEFITARNYISSLPDGVSTYLVEWTEIAYERSKRKEAPKKTTLGPGCIARTEYAIQKQAERRERMLKAWELHKAGTTIKGIAKYMGVTENSVRNYIRDMEAEASSK